jgi:hypothetical protein
MDSVRKSVEFMVCIYLLSFRALIATSYSCRHCYTIMQGLSQVKLVGLSVWLLKNGTERGGETTFLFALNGLAFTLKIIFLTLPSNLTDRFGFFLGDGRLKFHLAPFPGNWASCRIRPQREKYLKLIGAVSSVVILCSTRLALWGVEQLHGGTVSAGKLRRGSWHVSEQAHVFAATGFQMEDIDVHALATGVCCSRSFRSAFLLYISSSKAVCSSF